jgi:hypothetical protein
MTRGVVLRGFLALAVLVLPGLTVPAGAITYLPLFLIPAVFLTFGLLFRGSDASPPEADEDGGDGGDDPPVAPSPRPTGGLFLPEAQPSSQRLRDEHRRSLVPHHHRRPAFVPHTPRRPARR